ncbi:hypothetical protein AB5I41_08435 [Sphingomonas sp. MMS24-JH45]
MRLLTTCGARSVILGSRREVDGIDDDGYGRCRRRRWRDCRRARVSSSRGARAKAASLPTASVRRAVLDAPVLTGIRIPGVNESVWQP